MLHHCGQYSFTKYYATGWILSSGPPAVGLLPPPSGGPGRGAAGDGEVGAEPAAGSDGAGAVLRAAADPLHDPRGALRPPQPPAPGLALEGWLGLKGKNIIEGV